MAVDRVNTEAKAQGANNNAAPAPKGKGKSNLKDASVFLYMAEAMNGKLENDTSLLHMSRAQRDKQSVENALNNIHGLDETKIVIDGLLAISKKTDEVSLTNFLESVKQMVDTQIAARDKAYAAYQKALLQLEHDEDAGYSTLQAMVKNKAILDKDDKLASKEYALSNYYLKHGELIKALKAAALATAYIIDGVAHAVLIAVELKLYTFLESKCIKDSELVKDLRGVGNPDDFRNAVLQALEGLTGLNKKAIKELLDGMNKAYNAISKLLGQLDKDISGISKNKKTSWGEKGDLYVSDGLSWVLLGIAKTVCSLGIQKATLFEATKEKDNENIKGYSDKVNAETADSMNLIKNEAKRAGASTQIEMLNHNKAEDSFKSTMNSLNSLSKTLNNVINS